MQYSTMRSAFDRMNAMLVAADYFRAVRTGVQNRNDRDDTWEYTDMASAGLIDAEDGALWEATHCFAYICPRHLAGIGVGQVKCRLAYIGDERDELVAVAEKKVESYKEEEE